MHIDSSLWFDKDKKGFLGKGRIELLKNIDKYGSLSKAAKKMKMGYKAAWDSLNEIKNLSSEKLIISNTGGSGGGGSKLTKKAHQYIKMYELLFEAQQEFLKTVESHTQDFQSFQSFLKRNSLRTSARNQLFGKVIEIEKGAINSKLKIFISEFLNIQSSITNKSIKELGIKKDKNIYVLIKAPWVKITSKDENNDENLIKGKIKYITKEESAVEISINIDKNTDLISVMGVKEFESLHVKKNDEVFASFKPSDTIIGI